MERRSQYPFAAAGAVIDVFVGQAENRRLEPEETTPYLVRARFADGATHSSVLVQTQGVLER